MPHYKYNDISVVSVRSYMRENYLSQADLARKTGLAQSTVSSVLKDGRASSGVIAIIEKAIGISITAAKEPS